jgi:hypothetical protein
VPYCANCGREVAAATKLCPECGKPRPGGLSPQAVKPTNDVSIKADSRPPPPDRRKATPELTQKQTIGCLIIGVVIVIVLAYAVFGRDASLRRPTQPHRHRPNTCSPCLTTIARCLSRGPRCGSLHLRSAASRGSAQKTAPESATWQFRHAIS